MKKLATAAAIVLCATAASAFAGTVHNSDKATAHITFRPHAGKVQHLTLASGKMADIDCAKGGVVTMGKHRATCDAKHDTITLRNGRFWR